MSQSKIEWTGRTWNPTTGCSVISPGCKNCYAEVMTKRLKGMKQAKYANGFQLTVHPQTLQEPFRWKKPQLVFVNSMSDLFHKDVPFEFIDQVFAVMALTPQHTYQILTKRADRMAEYFEMISEEKDMQRWINAAVGMGYEVDDIEQYLEWPLPNVWLGVSVEDAPRKNRLDDLRRVPAAVRFISGEPLLQDLGDINLDGIHWVIAGGESGHGARPVHPDWIRGLRDQCQAAGVPFFFKQWGEWGICPMDTHGKSYLSKGAMRDGTIGSSFDHPKHTLVKMGKSKTGSELDGREWRTFLKVKMWWYEVRNRLSADGTVGAGSTGIALCAGHLYLCGRRLADGTVGIHH